VWRTRSPGKPVLLLHALNGISPSTLHFALEMESWGYRVYLPSLYGDPIMEHSAFGYDMALEASKFLERDSRWNLSSTKDIGPILDHTTAMANWVSETEGHQSIAVVGNCLTGSFPIALLSEPAVQLAVIAQPAAPVKAIHQIVLQLPQGPAKSRTLSIPTNRMDQAIAAMRADPSKKIFGFHYHRDPLAAVMKFDALHRTLRNSQLEGRFHAFVLGDKKSRYENTRSSWVTQGLTEQDRTMLTPHSTLINPESLSDREWFRNHLRAILDQGY
tara:strand:- start:4794 stop:5612 length:819 start_codon:yes stop_codon:yes gene_type:complete